ncbi:hypothetical protein [Mesorhizobium amorphae]|uniref:hypothetical protein n=1 Tax=Mesorhizobium amorphae TaxID=71433 RepID=UPI0021B1C99B|nr:hypothetical protein [Mesorhizobium amorphae]
MTLTPVSCQATDMISPKPGSNGDQAVNGPSFQQRVQPWMMACFGQEISADKLERADRFIEEALELVQSGGYPRERVAALTDYVYSREAGEVFQEVGGVMVTLAAYCLAHDLDMHEAGETELERIWTKVEQIRAKQAAKPTGSALPVAVPAATPDSEAVEAAWNSIADENNRWPALSLDERDDFIRFAAALRALPDGGVNNGRPREEGQ